MTAAVVGTLQFGFAFLANPVNTGAKATTTGNTLAAFVRHEGALTTLTVTDTAGNTYTPCTQRNHTNNDLRGRWFIAKNIAGHASNVTTVTLGGNRGWVALEVIEVSGLDTTAPLGLESSGNTTAGTLCTSGSLAATSGGILLGGTITYSTSAAHMAGGTGWTMVLNPGPSAGNHVQGVMHKVITGATTESPEFNIGSGDDMLMASMWLKEAAAGGGGITATLDATEAADTLLCSALAAIAATLSNTEAADAAASSAAAAIAAALAASEGADTLSASAASSTGITASAAIAEAGDTLASTAAVAIAAALARAEAADTANATAAAAVTATLARTEAADTLAASIQGAGFSASITEAADQFAASASAAILAAAAIAEAGDTAASTAKVGIASAASLAELADALSAQAAAAVLVAATPIEAPDVLSASSALGLQLPRVHAARTPARPNRQMVTRQVTSTTRQVTVAAGARPANLSRGTRK